MSNGTFKSLHVCDIFVNITITSTQTPWSYGAFYLPSHCPSILMWEMYPLTNTFLEQCNDQMNAPHLKIICRSSCRGGIRKSLTLGQRTFAYNFTVLRSLWVSLKAAAAPSSAASPQLHLDVSHQATSIRMSVWLQSMLRFGESFTFKRIKVSLFYPLRNTKKIIKADLFISRRDIFVWSSHGQCCRKGLFISAKDVDSQFCQKVIGSTSSHQSVTVDASFFTSEFVICAVAADDCFHRLLGTNFDPGAEDRRPLGATSVLIRSDICCVSDRSGGLEEVSVPHIPEPREAVIGKVWGENQWSDKLW